MGQLLGTWVCELCGRRQEARAGDRFAILPFSPRSRLTCVACGCSDCTGVSGSMVWQPPPTRPFTPSPAVAA